MPLRELKPLRADTYDTTVDTVYARNNAFSAQSQTQATPAPSAVGTGSTRLTENDVCDYEYVARDGGQTVGHTENRPDLVRLDAARSCQCGAAAAQSNGGHRGQTNG